MLRTRLATISALLVIFLVGTTARATAQVRAGSHLGEYWVQVHNADGTLTEMRVETRDRVEAQVTLEIAQEGAGRLTYRYQLQVEVSSPQSLAQFQVPCSEVQNPSSLIGGHDALVDDSVFAGITEGPEGRACTYLARTRPGGVAHGAFQSDFLPGIGNVVLLGATQGVRWPTPEPMPEDEAVRRLVDSLTGYLPGGVGRRQESLVPRYPRQTFHEPTTGLTIIRTTLTQGCLIGGWVRSNGLCRSLEVKLEASAASVARGNGTAARGQLTALVSELTAQRGKGIATGFADALMLQTDAVLTALASVP